MVIIAFYFYSTIQQTTTYKHVSTVFFQNQSNRTNTKTWGKILFTWVPGAFVFTSMTKIVQGRRCLVWVVGYCAMNPMVWYVILSMSVYPPVCAAATVFVSTLIIYLLFYFSVQPSRLEVLMGCVCQTMPSQVTVAPKHLSAALAAVGLDVCMGKKVSFQVTSLIKGSSACGAFVRRFLFRFEASKWLFP